jgi:protein ImuB
MRRILFIWLPKLSIERHLAASNRVSYQQPSAKPDEAAPLALIEAGARGIRIAASNSAARFEAVHPNQTLADARARCPHLQTAPADPAADKAALLALARWAGRYSPLVAPHLPDGLLVDIAGAAHLFGGEAGLIEDFLARLTRMKLTAHAGLADTPGAAMAVARFAPADNPPGCIVPPGAIREKVSGLPIEALRLDDNATLLLRRLGLKTVGAVAGLPRHALARRFRSKQAAMNVCLRLDQMFGISHETITPLRPATRHAVRRAFAEPMLEQAAITHGLEHLTHRLSGGLEKAGLGARRIVLTACRADGGAQDLEIRLGTPSRDAGHIMRLFAERIETLDPGFGIDALILTAATTEPLTPDQNRLVGAGADSFETPSALIDRLTNRLGEQNVHRRAPHASHLPERATRSVAAHSRPQSSLRDQDLSRPFRLFDHPEQITAIAEVPDGPPLQFTWRRLTRRVARARGPERIAPEWWPSGGVLEETRDYYEIEDTEGRRYWIYRAGLYQDPARRGPPRWYVHGLFA